MRDRDTISISSLPSPLDQYTLEVKLGSGIFGDVFKAIDKEAGGKTVAVKIQDYTEEREDQIQDEYRMLRDFTEHPNLIDFYGVFCDDTDEGDKLWFVMELCEFGSVLDVVNKLKAADKKLSEEHIAFILKYTIKGLAYLHEHNVIHRNVRCSNILINKDGEVKITDFGLACLVEGEEARGNDIIGPPSWMAPEVVAGNDEGYDNRIDVWALGISTIEMIDGKAPFQDMHPTRALFQILRNPPPNSLKPAMNSNEINDFITECLEKNPEHRPYMIELAEHPFIQSVPENDFHLSTELKMLATGVKDKQIEKIPERIVKHGLLITEGKPKPELMQVEDLAALEHLTEKHLMVELQRKLKKGSFTSFIGDILLILNPNTDDDIYNDHYHRKYECKSRSDNEPHIFAVADSAYQDALHHNEPQYIVFTGESKSGKTTNMVHALNHLTYVGAMKNNLAERIRKATKVIQESISAATPVNGNSTRAIFQVQVTYGTSGKLSGALFWLYQLEKWRVSSTDMTHANFNLLYYFYDAMEASGRLDSFHLEKERKHRYLRINEEPIKLPRGARESQEENKYRYREFVDHLKVLDFEPEDIEFLETILAAVLVIGNIRFCDSETGAAIENIEEAKKIPKLLSLEEVKFLWCLLNYCVIDKGTCIKKKHSTDDARDARDVLASGLYKRVIDWMINLINAKLSFMRQVFGDKFCVSLFDMFGFECFHRNRLEQLIVNTTNEQMQFLFNQRTFVWEMQEEREEGIELEPFCFYDNKNSVDLLMSKPHGLFCVLDEASRTGKGQAFVMNAITTLYKGPYIKLGNVDHEFCVAHYTGKVSYDSREMADKNRDFLPPEMIETMRGSSNLMLHHLFKNKLTKSGNLTVASKPAAAKTKVEKEKQNVKTRKFNTGSKGQYSQVHKMRTASAIYRATSLEILKQLAGSGGTHYVRCIRPDLADKPRGFQAEVVRQQVRALGILDTAKARQRGFSCRIPFAEFIRRYQFLAFDFDENVEETKDNCRLLLIRLKMEGWELGESKVFLKYYNEEFLSRLYETQVKKIVKVQSMMRAFLARRKANKGKPKPKRAQPAKTQQQQQNQELSEDEAAVLIQKAYRGHVVRKAYGPLVSKTYDDIDEETAAFLKRFAMKWKSRSMFQVLLQYRAVRYQDLVHFSQQVHIYNQAALEVFTSTGRSVPLDRIDPTAQAADFLGSGRPTVWKLPFRIDQIQYYDTSYMCDPTVKCADTFAHPLDADVEQWDEPLKHRYSWAQGEDIKRARTTQSLVSIPFVRDPSQPIPKLPEIKEVVPPKEKPSDRPSVYKKKQDSQSYYQPPEPWSGQAGTDENVLENSVPREGLRKTGQTRSMYGVNQIDMPNPISELQALAKSTGDVNNDEDAPPYNFQAMLKKTPKNRASMKRYYGEVTDNSQDFNERQSRPTRHIVTPQTSSNPTMSSHQPSRNVPHKSSRNAMDNRNAPSRVEIAPGITLEGDATDL